MSVSRKYTPNCMNCGSTSEDEGRWERKCTKCCKRYCFQCSNGSCPHCGCGKYDYSLEMVSSDRYHELCRMHGA